MEKELKLMAAYMVKESALTKGAKLQLINFIQNEASEIQIKGLLLDGEILGDLDEQATEILEQRFSVSEVKKILDDRFVEAPYIEKSLKKASLEAMRHLVSEMSDERKAKKIAKLKHRLAVVMSDWKIEIEQQRQMCMAKKDPEKRKKCLAKKIPSLHAYWKAQADELKMKIQKISAK